MVATVILLPIVVFAAPKMTINFGYDGSAKAGRYLPLNVTYEGDGENALSGNIRIFTRENDDTISEYKNEVKLRKDETKEVTYYVPVGIRATSLHVTLEDNSGNIVIDRDVNLGIDTNNAKMFIGILSDTPEKLEYLNNVSVNYGLLRTQTFEFDKDNFPKNSLGLDMIDVMVITSYSIRDLDEEQSHALMDWVRGGGVLLLGTGERVDDTLGRYAPELLDDMYEDPEACSIELLRGPAITDSDDGYAEVQSVSVELRGGNVLLQDGTLPVLTSVNKENGLIVVAAYDFADVSGFAKRHSTFAPDLLARCVGSDRMDALASEPYGTDDTQYNNVATLINTGDVNRIPPMGIYALSIIAFILLAGPVSYIFLKQRELSNLYRVGVVLLSLCFTVIIYLMGSRTRFDNTFYNYATIVQADDDSVTEKTFLSLRNPYNADYSVELDSNYTIYPVKKNVAVSRVAEDWSQPIDVTTTIARTSDKVEVSIGEVGAFTPQYFQLERSKSNLNTVGYVGDVTIYGSELSGQITNNYTYDVTDATMIFFGRMVKLGNFKAGETKNLDGLKVENIPLSFSKEMAAIVTDDIEKQNTIAFYRDYYMTGFTTEVHIIGFREKESGEVIVSNADLNGRGLSMIAGSISTYNRKDDEVYQSALLRKPSVISGNYDADNNTIEVGEPVILEYQLGNDIDLESVIFEWADKNKFSKLFGGKVSLYNYMTGDYDELDISKTVYQAEELVDYLSPSGSITIKYTYEGAEENGTCVALPLISVVGID